MVALLGALGMGWYYVYMNPKEEGVDLKSAISAAREYRQKVAPTPVPLTTGVKSDENKLPDSSVNTETTPTQV